MADDQHAVAGHRQVELERRDADCERQRKPFERLLRRKPARAAMTLQVKACAEVAAEASSRAKSTFFMRALRDSEYWLFFQPSRKTVTK